MPLLSEAPQHSANRNDDELDKSDGTALTTAVSVEGEILAFSADDEDGHDGATSKRENESDILSDHYLLTNTFDSTKKGTSYEMKKKSVIDIPAGDRLLPRTPTRDRENNDVAESTFRDENQNSDSSDDESSYFRDPRNLPDPKSDRRYSFSGSSALSERIEPHDPADTSRGPDLSLSFSEDSDELHHPNSHRRHPEDTQNGQTLNILEPFSQSEMDKTRSYSSLLSGEGSDDDLSSDPSIRNELNNVADQSGRLPISVPSGRKSPVLGEHPPSRGNVTLSSPSSTRLDPSPPTISSAYQQNKVYLHPQAQSMSQDKLANWLVAADAAYEQQLMGVNPFLFEDMKRNSSLPSGSFHSNTNTPEYSVDHLREPQNNADFFIQGMDLPVVATGAQSFRRNEFQNIGVRAYEPLSEAAFTFDADTGADQQEYKQMLSEYDMGDKGDFKVYWRRWLMLMYMSVLNLLVSSNCRTAGSQ